MKNREEITSLIADESNTIEVQKMFYSGRNLTVVYICDRDGDVLIPQYRRDFVKESEYFKQKSI